MTLATGASPVPSGLCPRCKVSFAGSGLVTAEMFKARHDQVVHAPAREQDILNAARSTRRKIAEMQSAQALRESKRRAKLAETEAKHSAAVARSAAAAAKRARTKRR